MSLENNSKAPFFAASNKPATVVRAEANSIGHLGGEHVQRLIDPLFTLAGDGQSNIVIDMSRVRSLTAQFLNVLHSVHNRLAGGQRLVELTGVHPSCAAMLSEIGLAGCRRA